MRTRHSRGPIIARLLSVLVLVAGTLGMSAGAPSVQAAGIGDSLAPAHGATVQTQNGSVLHSATVYAIYWKQVDQSFLGQTFYYEAPRCYGPGCLSSYGTDSNYENRTGTFLQDVGGSDWYGVLSQYWDANPNGDQTPIFNEVTLGGTWEDNADYPNLGRGIPATRLQPGDLQAEIAKAVQQNGWQVTPDSLFFIYIPEEVQACATGGLCTDTTINGDACGFHDSTTYNDQRIAYAVIPSPGDTIGCDATVTSPSNDLVVDNAINAEAHELVEAVTDPFNGTGWSDLAADQTTDGGEIGDKCEREFPGRGSALTDGGNLTLNGHDYILQSLWSDLDGGCSLGRVAVPYLDVQGVQTLQVEDGSPSILITGHDFSPTAVVQWNGSPIPTTYHASQALTTSIPAGSLARPGVATITVTQQNTSGPTSNPRLLYIIQNGAEITASSFNPVFGGTASVGSAPNALTVTANGGSGVLGLAQFSGNPVGGQTTGTTNSYFEIFASPTGFSGLTIEDCALNGGSQVDWYDPASGWKAASKQSYNSTNRCATVSVDDKTSPSLAQLQGTALAGWSPDTSTTSQPVQRPSSGATAPTTTINDTDPAIHYNGTGWAYYPGRPATVGDLGNDVHATTNNGDTVSYTFSGTGISYVSERSEGYGTVQVSLDGVVQTVVDANAPGVHNQGGQTLFTVSGLPAGQHTLTLEKTGGVYLLLDDFVVQNTATGRSATNVRLANDTDATIMYSGAGWGYYGGRPASVYDIQNDVHATTNNGDSVSYTFSGTGVSYISERSADEGLVDVYLDGVLQKTIDANAAGVHNQGGQILFSVSALPAGQHTIKLVKKSGAYLLLDAFTVQP